MMDHDQLPKGSLPDTLKAEDIPDRYILKGPPTGQVLGSFKSFQLGLLWKIPNVEESDALKPVAPDRFIEEKVFYEQNFAKHAKVDLPMKMALYKVSNSPDLHFRAVYSGEEDTTEDDEGNGLDFLRSKHQMLGASIVNESGKALLEEKFTRSYMFAGERYWEIPSLISAKEFGQSDLLTPDGSLVFRITLGNKEDLPAEHFTLAASAATVDQTVTTEVPAPESESKGAKKEETCIDEDSNLMVSSKIDIATIGLEPIPFHLTTFAKIGKFTDGIVHVADQQSGQQADFQVHRVVLAARSPYFDAEFEASPRVTIDKYSIPAVKTALEYMYSNQLKSKDFNHLIELVRIGEELQVNGLKTKSLNGLVHCPIAIPEAMAIFKLGIKHNSAVLRVHAHDFLIKLKGKIGVHTDEFKTFMEETNSKVLFDWLLRD